MSKLINYPKAKEMDNFYFIQPRLKILIANHNDIDSPLADANINKINQEDYDMLFILNSFLYLHH